MAGNMRWTPELQVLLAISDIHICILLALLCSYGDMALV
jgi:hypothetical protein